MWNVICGTECIKYCPRSAICSLYRGAKAATASCLMLSRSCLVPDPSGLPLDVLVHLVPNDGTLQPVTERDYLLKH